MTRNEFTKARRACYALHSKLKGVEGFFPRQRSFNMPSERWEEMNEKQKKAALILIEKYKYARQLQIL